MRPVDPSLSHRGRTKFVRGSLDPRADPTSEPAECQEKINAAECPQPPALPKIAQLRTCLIEVEFEALVDKDERRHLLNLPTTFKLGPKDVDDLIAVGRRLLRDSSAFQRLLKALTRCRRRPGAKEDSNCA